MSITKSLSLLIAIVIATALAATTSLRAADDTPVPGTVGRVLAISDGKLTVAGDSGKKEFVTDASTQVVANGGAAGAIADVKVGFLVKVIPGATDTDPVKKIKIFQGAKK